MKREKRRFFITEAVMLDRTQLIRLCGLVAFLSLATTAWSDTMTGVSSKASQGSNDSVLWSQLGADATVLAASVNATSGTAVAVTVAFAGPKQPGLGCVRGRSDLQLVGNRFRRRRSHHLDCRRRRER
jgi:hypothetical protein